MMDSAAGFTGPVNLGNPVEFTMLELAEKVLALTGSRSKIAFQATAGGRPAAAPARHPLARGAPGMDSKGVARAEQYVIRNQ